MGSIFASLGGILEWIGGVICVIGFIYFFVIWISQSPGSFLWSWIFGVATAAVGIGLIIIFMDLITDMINNFEAFYPPLLTYLLGSIILIIGASLCGGAAGVCPIPANFF